MQFEKLVNPLKFDIVIEKGNESFDDYIVIVSCNLRLLLVIATDTLVFKYDKYCLEMKKC